MWNELLESLIQWMQLPEHGLSTVFIISLLSATILPLGSEAAVFGLVKINPSLFWATIMVATIGNTLGGCISWWMGYAAHGVVDKHRGSRKLQNPRALKWLERFGPKACFLSFLPVVGDPLCVVAGWLRFSFWQCTFFMMIGKFLRYVTMTWMLLYAVDYGLKWW